MSDQRDADLGDNPRGERLDVRRGVDARDAHTESGSARGAVGGAVGGMVAGAAAGTITLGPIGTIIGALAGALGGGWAGMAAGSADRHYTSALDDAYRAHYESSPERLADRSYEHARPAYQLGHLAAHVPEYRGRDFDAIEPDLRRGWSDDVQASHGEWEHARRWARTAFDRARTGTAASELSSDASDVVPVEVIRAGDAEVSTHDEQRLEATLVRPEELELQQGSMAVDTTLGGTESHQRPSFADPIPPGDPEHLSGEQRRVSGRDEVSE